MSADTPKMHDALAPKRSAENWFLDAATFAHDGDRERAIEAARAGIAALNDEEVPDAT
jgi:hypothetical protein